MRIEKGKIVFNTALVMLLASLLLLSGCPSGGIPVECPRGECIPIETVLDDCSMPCNKECYSQGQYNAFIQSKDVQGENVTCYCTCSPGTDQERLIAKAYNEGDISVCSEMRQERGSGSQEECRIVVAMKLKDSGICETFYDRAGHWSKDHCYWVVASEKRDPGLCEMIVEETGDYGKQACYSELAWVKGDPSLCEKIMKNTGENSKDSCYFDIAVKNQDRAICDRITENEDDYNKENCYDWVLEMQIISPG